MNDILSYKHWRYKNTVLLVISVMVFFAVADTPFVHTMINRVGDWGYFGAVITGVFVVMTFTAAPALVVLYYLAERLNPIELSLLAGIGSVIGDFFIFSFFKDRVFVELEPIIRKISRKPFMHIFHTKYFAWLTPVLGAILIASPLPDEAGIMLLSASHMKKWKFFILVFLLDAAGIYLIIKAAHLILE